MGKNKQCKATVDSEKDKQIVVEEQLIKNDSEIVEEKQEKIENISEEATVDIEVEIKSDEQANKEQKEEKTVKRQGNVNSEKTKVSAFSKGLIVTAIILFVAVIALVAFAVINKLNNNVYHNIYINNENMSGKTEEEVKAYISKLNEEFKSKTIVIKSGEKEIMQITPRSIDMAIDEIATVAKIMSYGRDSNILINNINIFKALFNKQNIEISYYHSESKLSSITSEISLDIENRVIDDNYTVDNSKNTLVITRGKAGKNIVVAEFKQDVLEALKNKKIDEYELVLEDFKPQELDVDVVYAQVAKAAKDAYVDNTVEPVVYHKHELGITFDKEELRTLLVKEENKAEGKVIEFNLTTTKPSVTIQDITKDLYRDTLGTYTSSFSDSGANRASNVNLGAKMLNGTIVMPGETFSFNKVMGDCGLASRGFKAASVFKAGKIVYEVGGGICQISSTLYIAALHANLGIVSRENHALPVAYVPASLDATVYYPYLDFKFKNTRNYPIKIVASTTSSRKLTISICGTKEDVEYEVELTSQKTGSIAPRVNYQNDSSLEKGKTKVIQSGAYGYTSVAYKIVKLNGNVISKTLLSSDSYGSMPKIVAVGTKQVSIYGE